DFAHLIRTRPGHAHHRLTRLGDFHHLRAGRNEGEQRPDEDTAGTTHRGGHDQAGQPGGFAILGKLLHRSSAEPLPFVLPLAPVMTPRPWTARCGTTVPSTAVARSAW